MRKYWSSVSSSGISSVRKKQTYWRVATEMKEWEPVCSEERPRELCLLSLEKAQVDLSSVCGHLKTGCKEGWSRLFSVVPSARSRGHGHQLKHRRFPLNIGKHFFAVALLPQDAQGGGAVSLSLWRYSKALWIWSWVSKLKLALLEPGVDWKKLPPEVLSNILQSVILWTSVEVYPNSSDPEGQCGNARLGTEGD